MSFKLFPPTNAAPPYGPISILPDRSSFQSLELVVTFTPHGSEPVSVTTGAEVKLTWQQTESQPSVSFAAELAHEGATYTLLMTDPDAPTPHDTKYSYWRHWIQPGLRPSSAPGVEAKNDKLPLTNYLAPGKKEPTADRHRYLLVLYREPPPKHPYHSLTKSDVGAENFEARRAFDAKVWIEKYELEPVALAWFWGSG